MSQKPERIAQLCELLTLPAIHAEWSTYARHAAQDERTFADFLESVLSAERAARTERGRQALLKLATLSFIERAENTVLLGPSGVGKTQLPVALGHRGRPDDPARRHHGAGSAQGVLQPRDHRPDAADRR